MAEYMDVSISYVSQIERGITKISIGTLYEIAEFLNCDVTDLLVGNPETIQEMVRRKKEKTTQVKDASNSYDAGSAGSYRMLEMLKVIRGFLPGDMDIEEETEEAIEVLVKKLGKREQMEVAYFIACYLKMRA